MEIFGFYVSGRASRFKKFVQHLIGRGQYSILSQIKVVITDNPADREIIEIAGQHNIDCYCFDPSTVVKSEANAALSNFIHYWFDHFGVSYGFVFGARILRGSLLEKYRNRLINFHPSVLPSYKGLNPIDQALKDQAFLLGNTAHLIVEEVDAGPIIMQHIMHRSRFTDYEQLLDHQLIMLHQIIDWINHNRLEIDANGTVRILDATYETTEFIPNIEMSSALEIDY